MQHLNHHMYWLWAIDYWQNHNQMFINGSIYSAQGIVYSKLIELQWYLLPVISLIGCIHNNHHFITGWNTDSIITVNTSEMNWMNYNNPEQSANQYSDISVHAHRYPVHVINIHSYFIMMTNYIYHAAQQIELLSWFTKRWTFAAHTCLVCNTFISHASIHFNICIIII